jgi:exopolyphosphatase/pppGpp-phosphohydrolase
METAKIDIRKLQLLNDRINQTIDALNQVRLSVHGLSHSTATTNPLAALAMLGMTQNQIATLANAATQTLNAQTNNANTTTVPNLNASANQLLGLLNGLQHSTVDSNDTNGNRPVDLAWLARISQTFPYACSPIPGSFNL